MSRTRSRAIETAVPVYVGQLRYQTSGPIDCPWNTGTYTDKFSYTPSANQTTEDIVTENWGKIIAAGGIVNNPFKTSTTRTITPGGVTYVHEYGGKYHHYCNAHAKTEESMHRFSGILVPVTPEFPDMSGMEVNRQAVIDLAVTRANANIDVSEMLALATAAESRKTVDSIVSIMRRVLKIGKNLRKLNMRGLRRELTPAELSDRYMEARYALRPLIYDMVGAASSFYAERDGKVRRTYRGYASESVEETYANITAPIGWLSTATWEREGSLTVSARAGVLCDVSLSTIAVLGVNQPLESMWELLPFSFIIDWFANVGDTIAAWTPNAGVNQRASWVTVREVRKATCRLVDVSSGAPANGYHVMNECSAGYAEAVYEELVLERIVNPSLSTWPQMNMRLDLFKISDLGIILRKLIS